MSDLPVLTPTFFATTTAEAQIGVDEGQLVLQTGPQVVVPTLQGDIDAGYGYWSTLPMGYRFIFQGHVYQVVNRVWLPIHGGTVLPSVFGGDLDLHTCTLTGSTITWTVEAA